MKVSIVIPVYNCSQYILETLSSVKRQSFKDWECLIVDDCSTDVTVEVVSDFIKNSGDDRFKLFTLKMNSGVSKARNVGIEKASGDYVAFLDSDDKWENDKLSIQYQSMVNYSWEFTYCSYRCFGDSGTSRIIRVPERVSKNDLLYTCPIYTSSVMISKQLIEIGMPEHLRARQDYVTWLKVLESLDFAYCVDCEKPLMLYRLNSDSISFNKKNVAIIQWKIFREELGIPFYKSLYYFFFYSVHGLLKRRKQTNLKK